MFSSILTTSKLNPLAKEFKFTPKSQVCEILSQGNTQLSNNNNDLLLIRIIYNLPRDMSSSDVLDRVKWPSIFCQYKVVLFKFMHKGYHLNLPKISSYIIVKRECNYSSRASNKLDVPRSVSLVAFRDFDFSITSVQTSNFRRDGFTYY